MGNNRSKLQDLEKLVKGGRKKFVRGGLYDSAFLVCNGYHFTHMLFLLYSFIKILHHGMLPDIHQ